MRHEKENIFRRELAELLKKHNTILAIDCHCESITLEFEIENSSYGNYLVDTMEGSSIEITAEDVLNSIQKEVE